MTLDGCHQHIDRASYVVSGTFAPMLWSQEDIHFILFYIAKSELSLELQNHTCDIKLCVQIIGILKCSIKQISSSHKAEFQLLTKPNGGPARGVRGEPVGFI